MGLRSGANNALRSSRALSTSSSRSLRFLSPRSLSTAQSKFAPKVPHIQLRIPATSGQSPLRCRFASSSAPSSQPEGSSSSLSEDEYNEIADRDMDALHESIESLCEEFGPPEWEVEYSSGVMTIRLPPHGTYVINKQPPNQQIWISSPLSGPSRFGWDPNGEAWTHHRKSEVRLGKLLEDEIRDLSQKSEVEADGWEGTGLK